jgi:hypothetical protein
MPEVAGATPVLAYQCVSPVAPWYTSVALYLECLLLPRRPSPPSQGWGVAADPHTTYGHLTLYGHLLATCGMLQVVSFLWKRQHKAPSLASRRRGRCCFI